MITDGYSEWDRTLAGWADVILSFTFDGTGLPDAVFEIWWRREALDSVFSFVGTTSSSVRLYYHVNATQTPVFAFYKMRYVSDGIIGPFSEEFGVDV